MPLVFWYKSQNIHKDLRSYLNTPPFSTYTLYEARFSSYTSAKTIYYRLNTNTGMRVRLYVKPDIKETCRKCKTMIHLSQMYFVWGSVLHKMLYTVTCNGFIIIIFKSINTILKFSMISNTINIDRCNPYKQKLFKVLNFYECNRGWDQCLRTRALKEASRITTNTLTIKRIIKDLSRKR